ncbi:SpaH/EbpB family LPXTG-anchored major pilin [Ruminococcus sp.]|uniref:SpaH/EbpB family LPXTG-anchored major pilin n=1 Tax=Ruminococcus sp. TaxID=41978 RepID=UPI00262E94CB|nr:SpaH/EbpB family LPXTG-anchored major pilin [Ruminococcus sp.]MDD6989198.1 SpaH/EbpB family LPXTG-anchored major pilin [Ruminococcus sp.]MDY6201646.1 SpaH/EbpB family LPXTG-anchored major pilin [Ruminococcus sp.]
MKTTKKIFAALLAVMMIALMIPFSASAAETNTLTLNGKTGYTFTLYKVADVDTTTGEYKNITTGLESILTTKATEGVDSAALLTACNTLSLTGGTDYTYATGDALTKTISNLADGVYYLKVKSAPEGVNVTSVTNSVFALPYYTGSEWVNEVTVNAAEKITDGTPTVSKKFTNNATASSISEFIGKDVSFTLTGSVVGSTTEKAKSYQFVDTMSAGLTYKALTSVNLVKANGTKTDITSSVTYAKTGTTDNSFTLTIDPTVLANDDFYSNVSVEAVYTATVNTNAVIGGAGNPNKVDLSYTNSYNQTSTIEGNEVKVFTFDLTVIKVDANNTATKLSGAGFTLYTDNACTSVATNGAEVTTGSDGTATFTGLKAGTYYLKETTAPAGYNINSTVYKVNISDNGTVTNANGETITQVEVGDTPLLTPNTGGMGTMMFTIGGAALIACAGVLFLIVRKKKAAK